MRPRRSERRRVRARSRSPWTSPLPRAENRAGAAEVEPVLGRPGEIELASADERTAVDHLNPYRADGVAQREPGTARHRPVRHPHGRRRQRSTARHSVSVKAGPVPGCACRPVDGDPAWARSAGGGDDVALGERARLALAGSPRLPVFLEAPTGPRPGALVGTWQRDPHPAPG